ncbi:MAG TPA: hypothetical protein VG125_26850 [Pirellulales bacterium]|jgi:hypothetical protein|nr:hypothetical protein [Pirellulales bacterium]
MDFRTNFRTVFVLLAVLAGLTSTPDIGRSEDRGESAPAADESPGIKNSLWQPVFRGMAEDYRISPVDDSDQPFKLLLPPVFRWTQPVRGGDDGAVYVWLDGGRVMAVGTIFAWPRADGLRTVQHEFHSFSTGPMAAVWRGREVWSPAKGVERASVLDAPEPSGNAPQRLRQIKSVAAGFSGNSVDPDGGRWELRLLSNPLYRYALDQTDKVLDGALFALTQGTDPEVLLLIEATRTGGGYEWQYCCGRFSDYSLQVRYEGKEVWSVGPSQSTRDDAYMYYEAERRPKPEAPPEPGAPSKVNRK